MLLHEGRHCYSSEKYFFHMITTGTSVSSNHSCNIAIRCGFRPMQPEIGVEQAAMV